MLGARECGVASSERVRVEERKGCHGLTGIASRMNAEVIPHIRTIRCVASHCLGGSLLPVTGRDLYAWDDDDQAVMRPLVFKAGRTAKFMNMRGGYGVDLG